MANRTRRRHSFFAVVVASLAVLPFVQCQANAKFTNQTVHYSQFDLFKNTGLSPCPINTTDDERSLVSRGRGGRGGGATNPYVGTTWIQNEAELCKFMKGTPVMIPTTPTQEAFFPWWPTYLCQAVSLVFTYLGLWWTSRRLNEHEEWDMELPVTFWIQLPFDTARIVAWYLKTIHGFVTPKRFAWVNPVLWLLPFNYIWLVQVIGRRQLTDSNRHPMGAVAGHGKLVTYTHEEDILAQEPMVAGSIFAKHSEYILRSTKPALFWASVAIGVITLVQWCVSLAVIISHWQYTWSNNPRTQTYFEALAAVADPSTIGDMPAACLEFLKSTNLERYGLIEVDVDQSMVVITMTVQFVASTAVVVLAIKRFFFSRNMDSSYRRTFWMLKISATATLVTLGLPSLTTGVWILAKVVFGSQDVTLKYTKDLTATGGCTFGFVNMDKRWGYWDVQNELGFRIAMSVLGAA